MVRQTQCVFCRCENSAISRVQSERGAFCRHRRTSPASGQNPADSVRITRELCSLEPRRRRHATLRRFSPPGPGQLPAEPDSLDGPYLDPARRTVAALFIDGVEHDDILASADTIVDTLWTISEDERDSVVVYADAAGGTVLHKGPATIRADEWIELPSGRLLSPAAVHHVDCEP